MPSKKIKIVTKRNKKGRVIIVERKEESKENRQSSAKTPKDEHCQQLALTMRKRPGLPVKGMEGR